MDLENLMKNFSLTKDKEDEVDLSHLRSDAGDTKADRCVVGHVLSGKPFNLCALSGALQGAWRLSHGFKLQEIGNNLFSCEFGSIAEKIKIMKEGPWHFDRQLILFGELQGIEQPSNVDLSKCAF